MRKCISKLKYIVICIAFTIIVTSCSPQEVTSVLSDGNYTANITMEGGTGKAYIQSPVDIVVLNGTINAVLVWSSKNYDYMIVDNVKYLNENEGGNSTFTIPIADINEPLVVIADTVAMSTPHEIEYTLHFELSMVTEHIDLSYAEQFSIDKCGDSMLITIDKDKYLVVPENGQLPYEISEDTIILKKPLDKTYLVSTSAYDLINRIDSSDNIRLSGTKESDWYIDDAKSAMENGSMLYAGKYSAPDYELILSEGCDLAIENTMIYHNPEAKEKLEELGIPVLVEKSSYETHPLGRLEWIKVYGILYDKYDEACQYFDEQVKLVSELIENNESSLNNKPVVAFFSVTTNGSITVRKPGDYIVKMIELAGGEYALKDYLVEEENALSTMNIQMEDFYQAAVDADIIIYNSTIEGELENKEDILEKNNLFADFKAYKNGKVYCTGKNFFQESTGIAEFIIDLNNIIGESSNDFTYIKQL